jgi:hypothetical protein
MTEFVVTVAFVDVTASTRGVREIARHSWTDVAFDGDGTAGECGVAEIRSAGRGSAHGLC